MINRTEQYMATILTDIMSAWKKNPELRLSQLLVNASRKASLSDDIFYIDDTVLAKITLELTDGKKG